MWCWSHCCEASHLAGGWFLAEGRDKQQQGGTTATSAQGARRNLRGWLPSIQQDSQQKHELAVWERLFIAAEISAECYGARPDFSVDACMSFLGLVTVSFGAVLWFWFLLGAKDARVSPLALAQSSPAALSDLLTL